MFYESMNIFIAEIEALTIVSFVRASISVRRQLEREDRKRLIESLERADPQVKDTVDEFIRVVMEAIRYNSPMLNMGLTFASHCARLVKVFAFRPPIYDTYRYYENIHGRVGQMANHGLETADITS